MAESKAWAENEAINWDDIDAEAPKPLDPGTYCARVVEAEASNGQNGNKLKLVFRVTHAAGGTEGDLDRKLYDNLTLSKKAAFKIKQFCEATGCTPPSNASLEALEQFAQQLLEDNPLVTVSTGLRTYNGKTNPQILQYLKEGETGAAQPVIARAG